MKNLRRLLFTSLLLNGFIIGIIQAQTVDEIFNKFVKRYHTYQNTTLPFYVFTPDTYNPQIRYPLVLCLHGAGERGDNSSAVKLNTMATVWARDSNQARWPCFILVPQCPVGGWWTNSSTMLTVTNILDSLLGEFSVDTNRLYVTGISMGGYGSWDVITRFPDKFAAAIPVCGGGDSSKATLIEHIPIWNFHGAQDGTVPVSNSRDMIAALERAGDIILYTHCHLGECTGLPENILAEKIQNGAKHLYSEYELGGHSIWDQAYNTLYLLPWTFSQSKTHGSSSAKQEYFSVFPETPHLIQNYPNPFNPATTIKFSTVDFINVTLKIYDILGREIAVLVNETKPAGSYQVEWNAEKQQSGVYFCRMQAGIYTQTKKMLLVK